jgi:hypothetical protein
MGLRSFCAVFAVVVPAQLFAATPVIRFGLEHEVFGQATINSNYGEPVLGISNIASEQDGVTTWLGEADSAAFIYPFANVDPTGTRMRAKVYGSVNGQTNRLFGTVLGEHPDWATYDASVDFTPIGATSVTFQVWQGNILRAETTVASGSVRIYSNGSSGPRVNPWWLLGGHRGTLIEFYQNSPPYLTLPGSEDEEPVFVYNANRIFIYPNGTTGTVDFVSRTDVTVGLLEEFGFSEIRLGALGHAHAPLGDVKFTATNGVLTMTGFPLDADALAAGTQVEFDTAATANVDLVPLALALPNTNSVQEQLTVGVTVVRDAQRLLLSSVSLRNEDGLLRLFLDESYHFTPTTLVYSNALLTGSEPLTNSNITISNAARLVGVRAKADTLESPCGVELIFEGQATFNLASGSVIGNRLVLRAESYDFVRSVEGVSFEGRALNSITLVGEQSTSAVPQLNITRRFSVATLRWADPGQGFRPQFRSDIFSGYWEDTIAPVTYTNGFGTLTFDLDKPEVPSVFFRLAAYPYSLFD